MGSLNSDGTRISQSREMVRNIGRAHTVSADRTETETNLDQAPEAASDELGTNADLTTSQYSAVAVSEVVKVTTPVGDDLISREYEQVTESPVHQNPPWIGLGGGTPDLETVLAEGNTGSGIVLDELNTNSITVRDGQSEGSIHLQGPSDDLINVSAPLGLAVTFGDGNSFSITDESSNNYFDISAGEANLLTESATTLDTAGAFSIDGAAGVQININGGAGQSILFGGPLFSTDSYVHGLRHVEVVTMASGSSISLAAESGQVIIVNGTGPRTVNLTSGPTTGLIYDIKDGQGTATSGNITVNGNGANIDGSSTFALDVNYASYTFVYNGTEWNLI